MRDQSPTLALRDALASLPPTLTAQSMDLLKAKVEKFVDVAKAKDWPVERVIVAIKQVAAEAGVRSSTDVLRSGSHLEVRDAVLLDVVRWSVERYFGYSRVPPRRGFSSEGKKRGPSKTNGELRTARRVRWTRSTSRKGSTTSRRTSARSSPPLRRTATAR